MQSGPIMVRHDRTGCMIMQSVPIAHFAAIMHFAAITPVARV
jgi:hypothetical protein